MTAKILDGEKIAKQIQTEIRAALQKRISQGLRVPGLATILIGDNPASKIYVTKKIEACQELGMVSKYHELPNTITENELLDLIKKLNEDKNIDGILIQLPLPTHINTFHVIENIRPDKDVDGFHPYNVGRLANGNPLLRSCTPKGIITLLDRSNIHNLAGMNAVIVGASNIVGKPMALEFLNLGCTVTVCHNLTKDVADYVKKADILVSAAGSSNLIKGEWIKDGAIVIDVGMNKLADGRLVGDIDFEGAKKKA